MTETITRLYRPGPPGLIEAPLPSGPDPYGFGPAKMRDASSARPKTDRRRAASATSGLRVYTITDQIATAPKDWIIDRVLAAGEISALVAPPTTGKSMLAVDIAASVASQLEWFGYRVSPGAAVYIAAERAAVTFRRLHAFAAHHNLTKLDVGVVPERVDLLTSDEDQKRVVAAVREYERSAGRPVRLVTVDTVRAVMPGGDENSPRDMGNLARHLCLLREQLPGAHIQVLHHTPKGRPFELSGHTALSAAIDLLIGVASGKSGRTWKLVEANDLPSLPPPAAFEIIEIGINAKDGDVTSAPVIAPVGEGKPVFQGGRLKPDAQIAWDVLQGLLKSREPITYGRWREDFFEATKDRKSDQARKTAFSAGRHELIEVGKVQPHDTKPESIVSVRMTSD